MVTSSRSHRILLCEKISADCATLIDNAISINDQIRNRNLPIDPINLDALQRTRTRAEEALRDLEIGSPA